MGAAVSAESPAEGNRTTGGLILIDEATNATVGAAMITEAS